MGGVCPGLQESAGESSSNRSAKGNRAMRRLLNQLAHAAVRKRDCYLQIVFKRLSPRLGYAKAVWAIAHRLCRLIWKVLHEGVQYVEYGPAVSALTLKRRKQRLVTQLAKLGCGRGERVTAPPIPIEKTVVGFLVVSRSPEAQNDWALANDLMTNDETRKDVGVLNSNLAPRAAKPLGENEPQQQYRHQRNGPQ